jgi:hypothetical protein
MKLDAIYRELLQHQSAGRIAELARKGNTFELRTVGASDWLDDFQRDKDIKIQSVPNDQAYYFLADELRPGSGVIRSFGGRSEGPGGTLTCLLSSIDGRHNYFVGAGHVLSDYWTKKEAPRKDDKVRNPPGSIYRYRKGFPATNSTRFLGKLQYLSEKPKSIGSLAHNKKSKEVTLDIGIVELSSLDAEVALKQRTTCYGSFGEILCKEHVQLKNGQRVMKCGAEEPHETRAKIAEIDSSVTVYGPDNRLYHLDGQVILATAGGSYEPLESTDPPEDWYPKETSHCKGPFAVPGDSGTMIVDQETRRPLGMLIAGSVLDGRYVMTPIQPLKEFWERKSLILLRA